MAVINAENIRGMNERFLGIYTVETTKPPMFDRSSFTYPLNGTTYDFDLTFLLGVPTIHDWIGDKDVQDIMEGEQWKASSRPKEATIAVKAWDIQADKLGLIEPQIAKMGSEAINFPARQFAAALEAGNGVFALVDDKGKAICRASDGKTYDGLNLFSASHKLGYQTLSNLGSATWSIQAAIDTRNAMRAWVGSNGLLMGIEPDTLIVPRSLKDIVERDISSEWETGTADRNPNPIRNAFKVVYVPWLTSQTGWYMYDSTRGVEKPILELIFEELAFKAHIDPDSEPVWNRNEFQYSVQGHRQSVAGFPWVIYLNQP